MKYNENIYVEAIINTAWNNIIEKKINQKVTWNNKKKLSKKKIFHEEEKSA